MELRAKSILDLNEFDSWDLISGFFVDTSIPKRQNNDRRICKSPLCFSKDFCLIRASGMNSVRKIGNDPIGSQVRHKPRFFLCAGDIKWNTRVAENMQKLHNARHRLDGMKQAVSIDNLETAVDHFINLFPREPLMVRRGGGRGGLLGQNTFQVVNNGFRRFKSSQRSMWMTSQQQRD